MKLLWVLSLTNVVVSLCYSLSTYSHQIYIAKHYRSYNNFISSTGSSSSKVSSNNFRLYAKKTNKAAENKEENDNASSEVVVIPESELSSPKITKYLKQIEEHNASLNSITREIGELEQEYNRLDKEYGSEIARVKKEFIRMKERAIEESTEIISKAKMDALKEVLPINDNYYRAKGLYQKTEEPRELEINRVYEDIFISFGKVIEEFGVTRVESLGQPFDFNFMEAIMVAPSMDYSKDMVSVEYQAGYRMGQKCVRPAMVVVSTGPGPSQ